MTFINNFYLVLAGNGLLMLAVGLLWPDGFPSWGKVSGPEVTSLLLMTGLAVMPGFRWETRGLVAAQLAVYLARFLWLRKHAN